MRRAALALALAALTLAPLAPAHAGSCPLLTSPVNDLAVAGVEVVPFGAVDIRSGDLASGPANVVAVLRVRSLDDLPTLMTSVRWTLGWTLDGSRYAAVLTLAPAGTPTGTFSGPGGTTPVHTYATRDTHDITWTIPRGLMPELAKPKRTFRDIHAVTQVLGTTADTATTPFTYVDRAPGCIPAS